MNILNPAFKYTPAVATDLRKTFARIREQQAAEKKLPAPVMPIRKAK